MFHAPFRSSLALAVVFAASLATGCGSSSPDTGSDGGGEAGTLDGAGQPPPMDAGAVDSSPSTDGPGPSGDANSSDASNEGDAGDAGSTVDSGPFGGEWPGDGGWPADADLPYGPTNYDEPYRGQFHFTAPNGWLNDVNGVWYYGGVFHLSYQAYPYTLEGLAKHWGHATSTDMVHWVTAPVMLDPGVNVPGDAWSGSTVVDLNNTSGFQSGPYPVLVTIYTATSLGTSLAYSNDLGLTWQPYAGNPVAIGGHDASTRDPHVFWHAPTNRWVVAYYENGITFYTSPDLKTWTKTGSVSFGFECPDIYELPIDGDATKTKWVLQDASGSYLLGQFDGSTFTADPGGPYSLDVGPSFYASQTFYRGTFRDSRVVQMAWMRTSTPQTAPWNQAISFPAEVALKTLPAGVRATRTPIAEIAGLYGATQHWGAETLPSASNLLTGVSSKTFDFELALDLTGTAATTIQFQVANKTFAYDVKNATLLGSPLAPVNGQLKIRVLADWAELEVFGNDGALSYTESFGFTPGDASLSVTADAAISVVSADFRQLHRAWPGSAALSSAQLDDTDPATTYAGSWTPFTNDVTYLDATCDVGQGTGASVKATLTGTRVEWHGLKNVDLGHVDVTLDGALVAADIDTYSATRQIATLYTASELTNGPHTLQISTNGVKNPASAGTAMVHDFFASYVDP